MKLILITLAVVWCQETTTAPDTDVTTPAILNITTDSPQPANDTTTTDSPLITTTPPSNDTVTTAAPANDTTTATPETTPQPTPGPTPTTPNTTTTEPTTTTTTPVTPAPSKFNGGSFFGGMVFMAALIGAGYFGFRFYRARNPDYRTL